MKRFRWAAVVLAAGFVLSAQEPPSGEVQPERTAAPDGAAAETNINERYTIESVELKGYDETRLSRRIRDDIHSLVGQRFSQSRLDDLTRMIHKALPGRNVSIKVGRGTIPDHVKITFDVGEHKTRFDLAASKLYYQSRQGFTGEAYAALHTHSSTFGFGVMDDGDALIERYAGIRARYANSHVGTDRLRFSFEFGSLHNIWNSATLREIEGTHELYRTRQYFEPLLTVAAAPSLRLGFGVSFERFQSQYPAAHTEASNAVMFTLRYDRLLEGSGSTQQRVEAGYSLRAATRSLQSDYSYQRNAVDFRYALWHGNHRIDTHLSAGAIAGDEAPIFDRFVLGNSTTLRGWNKYDLAPTGGTRMVHNSVEYRYRWFTVFYDTGAVWTASTTATARHSAGAGFHIGELALLVAFPIRSGRAEPVFIAGLNL